MRNSKEIETEIDKIENRLGELYEMLAAASSDIEAAREAFTDGAAKLDDLHEKQSRLETLEATINSLEIKKNGLHKDFADAFALESKESVFGELIAIAETVGIEVEKYNQIRLDFNDAIADFTTKLFDQTAVITSHQKSFAESFDKLETEISNVHHIDYTQRPLLGKIKDELIERGASKSDVNAATRESVKLSDVEFDGCIEMALNVPRRDLMQKSAADDRARQEKIRRDGQEANKARMAENQAVFREQEKENERRKAERNAEIAENQKKWKADLGLR